jgi:hypothetical protein
MVAGTVSGGATASATVFMFSVSKKGYTSATSATLPAQGRWHLEKSIDDCSQLLPLFCH